MRNFALLFLFSFLKFKFMIHSFLVVVIDFYNVRMTGQKARLGIDFLFQKNILVKAQPIKTEE
jgi:hypothetical protein